MAAVAFALKRCYYKFFSFYGTKCKAASVVFTYMTGIYYLILKIFFNGRPIGQGNGSGVRSLKDEINCSSIFEFKFG